MLVWTTLTTWGRSVRPSVIHTVRKGSTPVPFTSPLRPAGLNSVKSTWEMEKKMRFSQLTMLPLNASMCCGANRGLHPPSQCALGRQTAMDPVHEWPLTSWDEESNDVKAISYSQPGLVQDMFSTVRCCSKSEETFDWRHVRVSRFNYFMKRSSLLNQLSEVQNKFHTSLFDCLSTEKIIILRISVVSWQYPLIWNDHSSFLGATQVLMHVSGK